MKRTKVLGAGVTKVTKTGLGSVLNLIGCEDGVSYLQQSPSVIKQKHGLRVAVPPPPFKGETEASAMHSWITLDTQLKFVHVNQSNSSDRFILSSPSFSHVRRKPRNG